MMGQIFEPSSPPISKIETEVPEFLRENPFKPKTSEDAISTIDVLIGLGNQMLKIGGEYLE